jgi:hypothetical protein
MVGVTGAHGGSALADVSESTIRLVQAAKHGGGTRAGATELGGLPEARPAG